MRERESDGWARTNDPKTDYGEHPPCPGCGGPVEYVEDGDYVCLDCDWGWEAWELIDKPLILPAAEKTERSGSPDPALLICVCGMREIVSAVLRKPIYDDHVGLS